MNIYCPSCGQANQHSGVKPNFCGFCQASLTLGGIVRTETIANQPRRAPIGRKQIVEDDENFVGDGTLPDIKKLDVEITIEQPHRETVGDIWGTGGDGGVRAKPKKVNKKQALQTLSKGIFETKRIDLNPND